MSQQLLFGADLVAIAILVFGIYFPRHRKRDMVVAYLGINVGVLAICTVLSSVDASVGLGVGLFGVLSIIRLRSDEVDQREVAYYFASLALGLLGGTNVENPVINLTLMGMLLAAILVGDHPRLLGSYRVQQITLDRAFTNEQHLIAHLSELLDARIHRAVIRRVDLVNDTTMVEVRFEVGDHTHVPVTDPAMPVFATRLAP